MAYDDRTELERIDSPGPIIRSILAHGDLDSRTAEERGTFLWIVMRETNSVIVRLPEWWVNQEIGEWTTIIAAHIDKESDKAYHLTSATPVKVVERYVVYLMETNGKFKFDGTKDEQRYNRLLTWHHRNAAEDIWAPKSLIQYGFRTDKMMPSDNVVGKIDDDGNWKWWRDTAEVADFQIGDNITEYYMTDNGKREEYNKITLKFGYDEDKIEDVKQGLDWGKTHRSYNNDVDSWTVDLDAVRHVIERIGEMGYTIAISNTDNRLDFNRSDHSYGLWFELPGREYNDIENDS